MRLIDADLLEPSEIYIDYGFTRIVYMDDIDEMPTVEVELVKHGKWVEHHKPYTWMGYTYWSCSECGFECGYEKNITIRTNYCPNCGAKNGV